MRAIYSITDAQLERTFSGEAENAIVIADGQLHLATGHDGAFDLLVVGAEYLRDHMRIGTARAAAAHQFASYGRHAIATGRSVNSGHRAVMSASAAIDVAREVLGADVAEQLRRACAARMLGR